MTDEEDIRNANYLRTMVNESPGFRLLSQYIDEQIKEGWEDFINLSPERKTSKNAYHHQAKYRVLKDLKEWIQETISQGEQASDFRVKEKEREAITH